MDLTFLSFGHGYTAQALTPYLNEKGWTVFGTSRSKDNFSDIEKSGATPILWGSDELRSVIKEAALVLSSVAPKKGNDPVIQMYGEDLKENSSQIKWAGYLSTISVYGDTKGEWVNESSPLKPSTNRGIARVNAEKKWLKNNFLPSHIFRLGGIYGPNRDPFQKVLQGKAVKIIKPGQVFSRMHILDIVQTLLASISQPKPHSIYNLCDDNPAPPQDVLSYAAKLLSVDQPPAVRFEDADLSEMAKSFYAENKRVSNQLIKSELGVDLSYPDYKVGLESLLDHGY
jgi:nucleoside-diphosphate-sugar epimerase